MARTIPLYEQIKESILAKIRSGELQPGERVPSENELAREAGVSRITTKQALNELAREGWVRRIRGKGTFVAKPLPPSAGHQGPVIGIVVPHLDDSYATRIVLGVESTLAEAGYHLVFRSGGTGAEETRSIRELIEGGVRGIIVWPTPGEYLNEELLHQHLKGFPIVLVDRFLRGLICDCAQSDNLRGGFTATRHLIQLGHRAIAYVAQNFEHITSVEERYLGYQVALREARIAHREEWLWLVPMDDDWPGWLRGKLEACPEVTAVCCENDHVAIAFVRAARSIGVKIPEHISVVGFDDIELPSDLNLPLTTVRQDAIGLGRTAARLLLERLTGTVEGTRQRILPVKLVVRDSTAPPRSDAQALSGAVAEQA
ncbi:MAG: GntR family transcriptional regulator [Firmicutes bacterium]|nr:GntR family transcriptional regulator [Bacillota bacterium]